MILPLASFPSYTFDPNGIQAFGDVVSDWGILEVTSGGALFVQRDGAFLRIIVPAPTSEIEGPSIVGDGYVLELSRGWTLHALASNGSFEARR